MFHELPDKPVGADGCSDVPGRDPFPIFREHAFPLSESLYQNRNFFNDGFLRSQVPSVMCVLVCAETEVRRLPDSFRSREVIALRSLRSEGHPGPLLAVIARRSIAGSPAGARYVRCF